MNCHFGWTINMQILSFSSCAYSQCRAGHVWHFQLLPLLLSWAPAGMEGNPVPSAGPRGSCGSADAGTGTAQLSRHKGQQRRAGASGHLSLLFSSSQKPPWHLGVLQGVTVTASIAIVPQERFTQGWFSTLEVRALSFSSALTPCCSPSTCQAFPAELIQPEGAFPAQLHPFVPRGTSPSPWPHPAGDTRISARCKTAGWLQAAGDVLIPESRVHISEILKQGELRNTGFTSEQLLESIRRERLLFHLVRAAWLLNSLIFTYSQGTGVLFLSLMCPWAELWAQCPHRRRLAGRRHSSLSVPGTGAGSWQPWMQEQYPSSLASCSFLHWPSPSTVNRERVYQLAGLILFKKHRFLVCIITKPDCFRDIKVSWVSGEFLQRKGKAGHLTAPVPGAQL